MKVVTASTPEQQSYMKEQLEDLYDRVFPCFFPISYIKQLKEFKLLQPARLEELTMVEILEVIAAVQTISTILETLHKNQTAIEVYEEAFHKNASILNKYDIDFPFELEDFNSNQQMNSQMNGRYQNSTH
ncbi:DUF5365 family protein [Radiobacillus deserti]|uniref:Uncharacterized protein n=1 Tax=Radiobacillus deserti TaxID=2594883 RepID=A0A516KG78_9BACI|nr:DUF5365 family protein [Radiobacillus deserti]QDP40397.1 hypothetical protein FN924_09520 [Radiobacillus deserti]